MRESLHSVACRLAVVLGFAVLGGGLSGHLAVIAAPGASSLRARKTATTVHLSWSAGTGPYGIYRSPDMKDILRPAWLAGGTEGLSYELPIEDGLTSLVFYLVDDPLPCSNAADCDNRLTCDGVESCNSQDRRCEKGAPILCNDGDACTHDSCLESTGDCEFTPLNCSDNDPCTLDSCRSPIGCYHSVDPWAGVGQSAELVGRSLARFPFFEFTRSFNAGTGIELGIDPFAHPEISGKSCDVYLVEARSAAAWCHDTHLADVRGAPETLSFSNDNIQANTFLLASSDTLAAAKGFVLGHGYDLVVDCNRNGLLDGDELVDGLEDEAGMFVLRDLTQAGPSVVSHFDDLGPEAPHCSGGGLDDMRIYHPSELDDPAFTGLFPLVVISHGNGHCYDWYDFLGIHLASYGFIVMSHDNNTSPGIETASTTTLEFTDKILGQQDSLGGGVLNGHIDATRIAWIGHSRGGEGVARAYDRLLDEGYRPANYSAKNIVVISSIAPTDFLGTEKSDPHTVPYHLLYGSADGDVCGCPGNSITQSFGIFERARGPRQSTYIHGADHNDFNCCGFNDFKGPADTEIGRPEAQQVQKATLLALLKYYLDKQPAPKDLLWRQYEAFHAPGIADTTVVVSELREAPGQRAHVVDDFQSHPGLFTSSSGGAVSFDLAALTEAQLREPDASFDWDPAQPMNGMARGRAEDTNRGAVFEFSASSDHSYSFAIIDAERDLRDKLYLSFRACQGTRHPETVAALEDLTFSVTLIDGANRSSSINIGAYGGGIEEPYQRGGYGIGIGWQNEFETIRIRISDFLRNGNGLDLSDIRTVRFDFGASFGSPEGRVAIDDIEVTKE